MNTPPESRRDAPVASTPRVAWVAALDRLGLPLLLLGRGGGELWRSAAFNAILAQEPVPARKQIVRNTKRIACRQLERVEPRDSVGALYRLAPSECAITEILVSGTCHYVIRTTCIDGAESFGTPVVVIVALEQRALQRPPAQLLRARFGLTCREAEVALLLAQRCQNAEIADRLCVSVHTARHHTERVLEKMRIQRRTHVTRVLQDMNDLLRGVVWPGVAAMHGWVAYTGGSSALF